MKNLLLLLSAIALFSCAEKNVKEEVVDYAIISGTVEGGEKGDTLWVTNSLKSRNEEYQIVLDENSSFKDTIHDPVGDYYVNFDGSYINVPLRKKYDVRLDFKSESIKKTHQLSGYGAGDMLLHMDLDKYDDQKEIWDMTYYGNAPNYTEEEYLTNMKMIYDEKIKIVSNYSGLTTEFKEEQVKKLYYHYLYEIYEYESNCKQFGDNKDFVVSNDYPNVMDSLSFNDSLAYSMYDYLHLAENNIHNQIDKNQDWDKLSYELAFYKKLDEQEYPEELKRKLVLGRMKVSMNYGQVDLGKVKEKILSYNLSKENIVIMDSLYRLREKSLPGAVCPDFEFEDSEGKKYSLKDFEGEMLVLDFWATWCLPCIKELPYLDSLRFEFASKDVEFVSVNCKVNYNDTKEKWEEKLEDLNLSGINLYSDQYGKSQIYKDLNIKGMPHYVIVSKEGKLIYSGFVKKPSQDSFKKLIEENL